MTQCNVTSLILQESLEATECDCGIAELSDEAKMHILTVVEGWLLRVAFEKKLDLEPFLELVEKKGARQTQ